MAERPDRAQVVKVFGREAADFIEQAAALGWRVLVNSTGTSMTLIPHDDTPNKRIHLSSKNKGRGALRKHVKQLVKYADPACIDSAALLLNAKSLPEEARVALLHMQGIERLDQEDGVEVMPPEEEKEKYVPPAAVTVQKKAEEKVKEKRYIVSERPHLMHKRLGKSYPSKTTTERRWSDGSIDYACAISTCDSTSDNHLSFRGAHWGKHVRNGEATPYDEREMEATVVDDPTYTEHAWSRKAAARMKRRDALLKLLHGLNLETISLEDLADQIDAFLGDSGGGSGGDDAEPMSDADVLDRIRTLVDRGTYADQESEIKRRDEQIVALSEKQDVLVEQALEAEQRAVKAESTMQAFRDLVAEMVPE